MTIQIDDLAPNSETVDSIRLPVSNDRGVINLLTYHCDDTTNDDADMRT